MSDSVSNPSVSLIIPVHNGGDAFRRCLSSVDRSRMAPREVIVVADGDTGDSWKSAEKKGARVLRMPVAGGPARARNAGARMAGGDILLFVDADVSITPDTVGRFSDIFCAHPDTVAVFGSYDDQPDERNFLSQYRNLLHHYVHQTSNPDASTFWAGCGAVRRQIFMDVGGFDERYRTPSIEDIALGYRLKKAGGRILLAKDIQVKHLKRWHTLSLLKADFFDRALPWTALILKEGHIVNDLNLKTAARISAVAVYLFIISLLLSPIHFGFLCLSALGVSLVIVLNRDQYRFFKKVRGTRFMLKTIPWHWFYFFYSGLAFAIGYVRHRFNRL